VAIVKRASADRGLWLATRSAGAGGVFHIATPPQSGRMIRLASRKFRFNVAVTWRLPLRPKFRRAEHGRSMPQSLERAGEARLYPAKEGAGLTPGGHHVLRPQKTVCPSAVAGGTDESSWGTGH